MYGWNTCGGKLYRISVESNVVFQCCVSDVLVDGTAYETAHNECIIVRLYQSPNSTLTGRLVVEAFFAVAFFAVAFFAVLEAVFFVVVAFFVVAAALRVVEAFVAGASEVVSVFGSFRFFQRHHSKCRMNQHSQPSPFLPKCLMASR